MKNNLNKLFKLMHEFYLIEIGKKMEKIHNFYNKIKLKGGIYKQWLKLQKIKQYLQEPKAEV